MARVQTKPSHLLPSSAGYKSGSIGLGSATRRWNGGRLLPVTGEPPCITSFLFPKGRGCDEVVFFASFGQDRYARGSDDKGDWVSREGRPQLCMLESALLDAAVTRST